MTIVFGAQNTSINFSFFFFLNSAEPRPKQQQQQSESLRSYTFWLLPVCVSDRDRLRMELLEV